MQISRGGHSEVAEEDVVCGVTKGVGSCVPVPGRTERVPSGGGASDARPCAHAAERATEVFGGQRHGVHQGQERDPHCPSVCWAKAKLRGAALLGAGLLGLDSGQRRSEGASIHPGAREGRSTLGTTGTGGALSASR